MIPQSLRGAQVLPDREALSVSKELLDTDPDRGVVLLGPDGRVHYHNTMAGTLLRDGSPRGTNALLPLSVEQWLTLFAERARTQRTAALGALYYPSVDDRSLRITVHVIERESGAWYALRVQSARAWDEPTVKRLQVRFGLTLREAQVAAGVSRGYTNAEVASQLGIVEKTVKNVLMSVFTKCSVRNRVELALRSYDAPVGNIKRHV